MRWSGRWRHRNLLGHLSVLLNGIDMIIPTIGGFFTSFGEYAAPANMQVDRSYRSRLEATEWRDRPRIVLSPSTRARW
jgi:hypothetical protein